jgi:hypothetical protein
MRRSRHVLPNIRRLFDRRRQRRPGFASVERCRSFPRGGRDQVLAGCGLARAASGVLGHCRKTAFWSWADERRWMGFGWKTRFSPVDVCRSRNPPSSREFNQSAGVSEAYWRREWRRCDVNSSNRGLALYRSAQRCEPFRMRPASGKSCSAVGQRKQSVRAHGREGQRSGGAAQATPAKFRVSRPCMIRTQSSRTSGEPEARENIGFAALSLTFQSASRGRLPPDATIHSSCTSRRSAGGQRCNASSSRPHRHGAPRRCKMQAAISLGFKEVAV